MNHTYSIYHAGDGEIIGPFDSFSLAEDFFYRLAQHATTMYYLVDDSTGEILLDIEEIKA